MPRIAADLHGYGLYGVTIGSLLVASALGMAFAGPLADRFGTQRVLATAFALVAAGLICSALARSMPQLASARAIEGLGGGLDYAGSFAAIAKHFDERVRSRLFAWLSAMWVIPALVGPSAGALIATDLGWRYAFAAFLPLVLLAAVLVLPALGEMHETLRGDADAFGSVRMLVSRATLTMRDQRHAAFVAFGLLHVAFFGADAYVTLDLTLLHALSLVVAGLCLTFGALGWSIASAVQPSLLERYGTRVLALGGAGCLLLACAGMIVVALGAPVLLAFPAWFAAGAGIGCAYPTLTQAALAGAGAGSEGIVSSATLLAGTAGMAAGVLACGTPIAIAVAAGLPLEAAIVACFAIAACAAAGLFTIAVRALSDQRSTTAS